MGGSSVVSEHEPAYSDEVCRSLFKMKTDVLKLKGKIESFREVTVVSHLDADGITSAGIMNKTFERLGIPVKTHIVRQLDRQRIKEILDMSTENIVFTDLGSGQIGNIKEILDCRTAVIIDHHVPCRDVHPNLLLHLNAHIYGVDGSRDVSGAGLAYFFSRFMTGNSQDLSSLAIVGAVGDMQTRDGLRGLNKVIFDEGAGEYVGCVRDLSYFGKQTRPVYKMLSFASDPYLAGITGSEGRAMEFVESMIGSGDDEGDRMRCWVDLGIEEKQEITTGLISHLMSLGYNARAVNRLIADTYILLGEDERTETRDAMEFSTLLNACGRHNRWRTGLEVVLGDRDAALCDARCFLQKHRNLLAKGLQVLKDNGVCEMENIQVFMTDEIKSTIVGVVIGMAIGARIVDQRIPIIAVSRDDDPGYCKISARGTMGLVYKGLRLNRAMELSRKVGGEGGGHDVAAGAKVRKECLDEFLGIVDEEVGKQMK